MGVKIRLTVVSLVPLVALMFVAGSQVAGGSRDVRGSIAVVNSRIVDGSGSASVVLICDGGRCLSI
jgi:hypothetical protein